ncbi:unnamed protein product [Absidia cylindrospora]
MATDNDYQVKGVFNKMKQAVHYYNVMESKVLQATNTDAWGAPSTLMRSLAQGTMETEKLDVIMPALYRRLTVKDTRQWLQVYKALVLLEYLIKYGDDQVLAFVQSHPQVLTTLQSFEFIDEKGQDKGYNVRVRSKTVNELVKDPEEIKRIRENGRLSQDRFIGVSSDDVATSPTMENNNDDNGTNVSAKQLPPIQTPPSPQQSQQPQQPEQEQEQQDDMDDAIFREDFIDPLEEDNHAMVFPAAGGKGTKTKLSMDDMASDDDDNGDQEDKKKKKKTEKSQEQQQQKKKSRFSFSGVFSRSKQPAKPDNTTNSPSEDQQDTATPIPVANEPTPQATTNDTSTNVTSMDTATTVADNQDDDGWGDFASPDQGTNILEVTEQKEDDLLDLDCDMMTTSSARTSVDNNDLLLLDVEMPSFNNSQYPTHNAILSSPMSMMMMKNNNAPPAMTMMMNTGNNTPTTPFDFDPLGYAGLKTPTTPPPAPAAVPPQQLTQHWYPWMATGNISSYQQKQHQRPVTVDDLLS